MQNHSKRRRIIKVRALCIDNSTEFCTNTSLHGLHYLVDRQLGIYEKSFFGGSIILVMVVAIYFISNVYAKWENTPVIVGLNAVPTFITKSPFPAVTICNLSQGMKSLAKNIKNDTIEYAMLQVLCNREVPHSFVTKVKDWSIMEQFIINISQPCDQMILSCRFGSIEYNCSEIFRPVVTDEGLCCGFNMVHPDFMFLQRMKAVHELYYSDGSEPVKWDPEKGYPKVLPRKFYPRVAAGTGESLGFTLILDVNVDDYQCSSANGPGFKISLHSPTETPHLKETGLLLQPGYETKMRITAVKSEAGNELRSVKREYRQCIFNAESNLEYYTFYTKRNCEIECDAKLLVKNCDCVSYYLPKLYSNVSTCGIKDLDCVERVTSRSHLLEMDELDCHDFCQPSCFDLTFLPDFFMSPISHDGFSIKQELIQNMSNEYASKNIAVAHMYFKENTFRSSVKTQFIGITDFLSNTGGLMGLFMGFSFISLAELMYFGFLRPLRSTICQRNSKEKQANTKVRPTQTRQPLDYTLNKRFYNNYRPRLVRPPASIPIIHGNQFQHIGTNSKFVTKDSEQPMEAPPFPYNH